MNRDIFNKKTLKQKQPSISERKLCFTVLCLSGFVCVCVCVCVCARAHALYLRVVLVEWCQVQCIDLWPWTNANQWVQQSKSRKSLGTAFKTPSVCGLDPLGIIFILNFHWLIQSNHLLLKICQEGCQFPFIFLSTCLAVCLHTLFFLLKGCQILLI